MMSLVPIRKILHEEKLVTGTASRAAIGFSPTIYASSTRTFAVMNFCIMAAGVLVFSKNIEKGVLSDREMMKISYAMKWMIFFSFLNLWFLVSVVFK